MDKIILGPDGTPRCSWCSATPEYIDYHDQEWGYPVADDRRLFEKICLESFQSGLSWRTILTKREGFRAAFYNFDFNQMAEFSEADVERLVMDKAIVRHRGKIEAVINNAQRLQELIKQEGSLAAYVWRFEPKHSQVQKTEIPSITNESIALSKDLKKRGWKFVGPTTVYAFMQAMGLVNDHSEGCKHRNEAELARKNFIPPVR